jgi:hypothetical protein
MSECLLRSRQRIQDGNHTSNSLSLSAYDQEQDRERNHSEAGRRAGQGNSPAAEHTVTAASASSAGHSLSSVPVMPPPLTAATPTADLVGPDTPLRPTSPQAKVPCLTTAR